MKRRLFNLLATVSRTLFNVLVWTSLILLLATVMTWVRSYFVCDYLTRTSQSTFPTVCSRGWEISSSRGGFSIVREDVYSGNDLPFPSPSTHQWNWNTSTPHALWDRLPMFSNGRQNVKFNTAGLRDDIIEVRGISFGLWFATLIFLPLPAILFWRFFQKARRPRPGFCVACGYDLRATPQGGRCPECGTVSLRATHANPAK